MRVCKAYQQHAHAFVLTTFQILSTSKQGQQSIVHLRILIVKLVSSSSDVFSHLSRFGTAQVVDEELVVWVPAVRSSLSGDSG